MTVENQFQEAADKATQASEQAGLWATGPDNTTVPTDSGPVPTIAEFNRAAQERVDASIEAIGWVLAGDFTAGCTVTDRNQYVLVIGGAGYRWDGVLPKVVSPGSSPTPIAAGSWVLVGDMSLRGDLAATSGGTLVKLANGKTVQQDSQQSGIARGNNNVGYTFSAGAFRRDTAIGPDWFVISDSAHIPVNISSVSTGSDVTVNFGGTKVGAPIVVPDETFALDGTSFGSSGGATFAVISMGTPCSFSVNLATGVFSFDSRYFDASRFGVSISASGFITLTHPQIRSMRNAIVRYVSPTSSDKDLTVHYQQSPSAGSTTLSLVGDVEGIISYNGTSWVVASSDQWVTADITPTWNAATGELTIVHPSLLSSPEISVNQYYLGTPLLVSGVSDSATQFTVRFTKLDGTVPVIGTGLGFRFSRGNTGVRRTPTGTLLVSLGQVQVNCSQVSYPSGNFWLYNVSQN